jgi:serine/threonine-protein kinase
MRDDDQRAQSEAEPDDIFTVGELLNGVYEVRGLLGSGGMGQVFEGYDLRLRRAVAIKAAWEFVGSELLTAEARVLAHLHHQGLVTVHAMGTHKGVDYFVMEKLSGVTLADHIDTSGGAAVFTVDEVLDTLIGMAEALAAVHRAGITHRDLKPDNIMLTPGHRVVLLDFGTRHTEVQERGGVYGSPLYMAPECVKTAVNPAHKNQVDIYAFGCIAFEMLTGTAPFEADTIDEILRSHVHAPPPRVSSRRRDISVHFDRLINEMLAKEPADRPQSIDVVAAWLRAIRRDHTGSSRETHLNVLIADNDPKMLGLLESCVAQAAPTARVRTAVDGVEALDQVRQRAPDVLLLDLRLPRMTGMELCMHLCGSSLADETAIIVVSAHASESDIALLQTLGVSSFVSKRSGPDVMIAELVELMRGIYSTHARIVDG